VFPFLIFLLVSEMPYYHSVGQRRLMDTHLDVSRKSGEFVKVDLSGLVCVLTRCEDIHHTLGKIHCQWEAYKKADQELYGFNVEGCKPP
jgi:hypothetical protein